MRKSKTKWEEIKEKLSEVRHIYEPPNGNFMWDSLLHDEPKWAEEVQANTQKGRQRLYQVWYSMKKNKVPKKLRRARVVKEKGAVTPATVLDTLDTISLERPAIHHCPRCKLVYFDAPNDERFSALFTEAVEEALRIALKHYNR